MKCSLSDCVILIVLNEAFALSPLISTWQRLIQLPETAAVLQRSALSVSCRWDLSSVSTPTLRKMVTGTSVRSATAGKETNQPYVDTSEFTPERCHSPALTAPTELLKKTALASMSDTGMKVSYVSSLRCLSSVNLPQAICDPTMLEFSSLLLNQVNGYTLFILQLTVNPNVIALCANQ